MCREIKLTLWMKEEKTKIMKQKTTRTGTLNIEHTLNIHRHTHTRHIRKIRKSTRLTKIKQVEQNNNDNWLINLTIFQNIWLQIQFLKCNMYNVYVLITSNNHLALFFLSLATQNVFFHFKFRVTLPSNPNKLILVTENQKKNKKKNIKQNNSERNKKLANSDKKETNRIIFFEYCVTEI